MSEAELIPTWSGWWVYIDRPGVSMVLAGPMREVEARDLVRRLEGEAS